MMANVANPSGLCESKRASPRAARPWIEFTNSDIRLAPSILVLMRDKVEGADLVGLQQRRLPTLKAAPKACAECAANRR